MADFHGILIDEDNSLGNVAANGGAPDPGADQGFVSIADANNRALFVTASAGDRRLRVTFRKAK